MGKVIKFEPLEIPWTARCDEYGSGIMVGRFNKGNFEDIHFDTVAEYLNWKFNNNAKVTEHFFVNNI